MPNIPNGHPTISAVIPAFNSEKFISDAIGSILAQTVEVNEIIVVDDGSSDRTADVATGFPNTKVIRQVNSGQGAARNAGIRAASGEWIAFLDSDDVWLPRKTEVQLGCIRADTGVVHCNRFNPIHFGSLWHRQAHVSPSGAIVRKKTLLDVGGFEESRAIKSVEDLNLWLRIALTEWQFVQSETGLFKWRLSGQNESGNDFIMAAAELANINAVGKLVHCDPDEIERVKQASKIEYAKNLVAHQRWDEAARMLQDCKPGLASRWLGLARFLQMNRLARTNVVRWLQSLEEGDGSRACSGECSLPEVRRTQCVGSGHGPHFRPL